MDLLADGLRAELTARTPPPDPGAYAPALRFRKPDPFIAVPDTLKGL